jgi:Uma2 family endonuclease
MEAQHMVQTPVKPLSLAAFLELPETEPASEYVEGQIIQKPMPQGKHRILQRDLGLVLMAAFQPTRIAQAIPELRCTFGGRSIIPDMAVFLESRVPRDGNGEVANVFPVAPDWTIEILSPHLEIPLSNRHYKRATKNISHCLDHGCQMGWLIDPEEKTVVVSPQESRSRMFEAMDAVLPVPDWSVGLELTVGELFGWLLG